MLDILSYTIELLARALLAVPFIHSGVTVIMDKEPFLEMMETKNLPFAPILLLVALALKIGGGFCIIFGIYTTLFAFLLAGFTAISTYLFHDFWNYTGVRRNTEIFWFTTNAGLIGGLLLLASMKMPLYL